MTFEQKKARAIALMDSKKMWRSNYAPPLLRILWRLGIRLPPLPFMPVTDLLLPPHNATSRQHNMWCRIQLLITLYVVSSP